MADCGISKPVDSSHEASAEYRALRQRVARPPCLAHAKACLCSCREGLRADELWETDDAKRCNRANQTSINRLVMGWFDGRRERTTYRAA